MKFNLPIIIFILFTTYIIADDSTVVSIGPGVKYHSVYKTADPNNIKILEIDLSNSGIFIDAILANDKLSSGAEKTSSMVKRRSKNGFLILGAVNADFFGGTPAQPINNSICNNTWAKGVFTDRTLFGITKSKVPIVDLLLFKGYLYKNTDSILVNELNQVRDNDELICYTNFYGSSTQSNQYGTEIKLKPISQSVINQKIKYVVLKKENSVGNMSFEEGTIVLSGHGSAKSFLDSKINIGDTVTVSLNTSPNKGNIFALVGGGPRLVTNGARSGTFNADVHPRTAVGFNQDSTKVFFVTVDGRQAGFSVGLALGPLADYMISIGCYQAVNLDGGGSTTMVVRDAIVNRPSDATGERPVYNSLVVYTNIDYGLLIDSIKITPKNIVIDSTQKKKLNITAKDKWGFAINLKPADLNLQFVGVNGKIDSLGYFISNNSGEGMLIASINNLKDTIFIKVTGKQLTSYLAEKFDNLKGIISMKGEYVNIDSCKSSLSNINYFSPPSSWKIAYNYTATNPYLSRLFFITSIPFPGKPDSIKFFSLNDGNAHQIKIKVSDRDNLNFYLYSKELDKNISFWQSISFETKYYDPVIPNTTINFPISIEEMIFTFKKENALNGQTYKGEIFFDDITAIYNPSTIIRENEIGIKNFQLFQNYPNPFNPVTKIKYSVVGNEKVTLKVYDLLGREVVTLVDEVKESGNYEVELSSQSGNCPTSFITHNLSSGVYFYQLCAGNFISTKKMILMK